MSSMLKSTMLSFGLLAGTALAAQAQSVSSLPPANTTPTQPPSAVTQPYTSTQRIVPDPGGSVNWKQQPYQPQSAADYANNPADHPYSAVLGPKPN